MFHYHNCMRHYWFSTVEATANTLKSINTEVASILVLIWGVGGVWIEKWVSQVSDEHTGCSESWWMASFETEEFLHELKDYEIVLFLHMV